MAAAIPLIIAAAGAGVNAYNQHQAANAKEQAAAEGIRQQALQQQQANADVTNTVQKISQSNPDATRKAAADQFMAQLQRNRSAIAPTLTGASGRYGADVTAQTGTTDALAADTAKNMAAVNAPGMQRQAEGLDMGQLATDIGGIRANSQAQDFLTQLRARAAQPNPWLTALSQVSSGYAKGASEGAYG
jgi:hypothetical protein